MVGCLLLPGSVMAENTLSGTKEIVLLDKQGQGSVIGTVTFKPDGEASTYQLEMDHERFFLHDCNPLTCIC